jgi:cation:H+ antiporter
VDNGPQFGLLYLLAGLALILASCELFTNGIEWLGRCLRLSEGAVGSVLAAVGTALPETMVPLVAILMKPGEAGEEVGIGAILGAPFMLSTLAFAMVGVAAIAFARSRESGNVVLLSRRVVRRDLKYFLVVYTVAVGSALLPPAARPLRWVLGILLLAVYVRYILKYLRTRAGEGEEAAGDLAPGNDLASLYLCRLTMGAERASAQTAPLAMALVQSFVGIGGILLGARLFVDGVDTAAQLLGISREVLALLIAPIATELPEKFNSILWVRRGRDTLALGNITGAMVFQSCIPTAVGMCLTHWQFTPWEAHLPSLLSAAIALVSASVLYLWNARTRMLSGYIFLGSLSLYAFFLLVVWRYIVAHGVPVHLLH